MGAGSPEIGQHKDSKDSQRCANEPCVAFLNECLCFLPAKSISRAENIGKCRVVVVNRCHSTHDGHVSHSQRRQADHHAQRLLGEQLCRTECHQVQAQYCKNIPVAVSNRCVSDQAQQNLQPGKMPSTQQSRCTEDANRCGKAQPNAQDSSSGEILQVALTRCSYCSHNPIPGIEQERHHDQLSHTTADNSVNPPCSGIWNILSEMIQKNQYHKDAADSLCLPLLQVFFSKVPS